MSGNGSAYESHVFRDLLQEASPRHALRKAPCPENKWQNRAPYPNLLARMDSRRSLAILGRASQRHETKDRRP
ncbi:MAG: hypothetical protein ACREDM_14030 [Methylocella sp.]